MKTKTTTLITAAIFALTLTASAEKPFNTFKLVTFGETAIEIRVEVEKAVRDIHLDLAQVFTTLKDSEENLTENQIDVSDFLYEEPATDDFGFDTKAVFEEILKEKTVK